ncbi:MAG: hypothetical protein H6738_12525 [Alphaproteobacteria bacterium]|nr:hypothetical protein [Alphaproteobacteria bacterium]
MSDGITRRPSTHLAILVTTQLLFAWRFWFVCDDAYITFRYAKNLAFGYGLVFNRGEFPPVEGYSDFLWLMLAAAFERATLPTDLLIPLVSMLAGTAMVTRVYGILHGRLGLGAIPSFLATLTLAASPAIGVWSTSGLEAMPQTLLTVLLFEELVFESGRRWGLVALLSLLLATIRTEGVGWVAVVAGASLVAAVLDRKPLRPLLMDLLRAAVPVAALLAAYHVWRFQYYATLVPNTALVKVGFGAPTLGRGVKYVLLFELTTLVPAISLLGAAALGWVRRRGVPAAITLVAVAYPTYSVVVGGDFMPFGRMLIPGLPFAAMLLGLGLQELGRRQGTDRAAIAGIALVAIGVLPGMDVHLVPRMVREQLHFRLSDKEYLSEYNRWENQRDNAQGFKNRGIGLSQVAADGDAVVAAAVGAIGYFSDLEILDQHGLVTKEIAYKPLPAGPLTESPGHDKHVDPSFFTKYRPRWLYARTVWGKLAAGRMKDTLDQWDINRSVTNRYVPDYYEITLPGVDHRAFLLVVRLVEPLEDPAQLWEGFAARRRALNAELRAEYEGGERWQDDDEDEDLIDPIDRGPLDGGDEDLEDAFLPG